MPPLSQLQPDNLFSVVAASHELVVSEPESRLCPLSLCPLLTSDRAVLGDLIEETVDLLRSRLSLHQARAVPLTQFASRLSSAGPAAVTPEAFADFLANDLQPRSFRFVHTLLPHRPYQFMPSGTHYAAVNADSGSRPVISTWTGGSRRGGRKSGRSRSPGNSTSCRPCTPTPSSVPCATG